MKKTFDAQSNYQPAITLVELSRLSLESSEKLFDLSVRQVKENLSHSTDLMGKLASAEPQAYTDLAFAQARQRFSKGLADFTEFSNAVTQAQVSLVALASKAWQVGMTK